MILEKEMLLGEIEQQQGLESIGASTIVADRPAGRKGVGNCARCGRKLTNPHSIARNLGPVCYAKSGGGAFDGELQATEEEWHRREQLLQRGGEHDFGWWDYVERTRDGLAPVKRGMRISIRCEMGRYIAYGAICRLGDVTGEVVFYSGCDLKAAWRAAIAAGPESNAAAYRVEREITRAWKAQLKARVRGGGR
ncbi:MAG TPA: hypothetical protein GX513_12935 [Firmicutes bacterium]|nr:hypothetical protein [Bacillota bacterium]